MLAGLIAACLLAADPTLTVEPLDPARPGGLLRVAVLLVDAPATTVSVELLDGATVLANANAALPLGGGRAVLVLAPGSIGSGTLHVRASATWTGPGLTPRALTAEATVETPASVLGVAIAAVTRLRASGRTDPLPWLWAEQIAELSAGGASVASIGGIGMLGARLSAWLDDPRPSVATPGANDGALRDPVDGSVQPFRLHLPSRPGPHPLILLLPPATPSLGKAHWAGADRHLVDTALEAGLAVVVCYPAGDRAWDGAARRRVPLTLAAAAAMAPLDLAHGACVGEAAEAGLPYAVHRLPMTFDAAWCRSLPGPPRPVVPGDGWADAPFVVVVGSAEHAAARATNHRLADSLRAAYAAHAHAVIDLLSDDVDPATLAGRNLVLIGNPLSNRLLARLHPDLPWRWDHREAIGPDGVHHLRVTMPFLACAVRLPDGRLLVVLDGPPPAWGIGLPLAGLRPRG